MAGGAVYTGDQWNLLKETINNVMTDDTDGFRRKLIWPKWIKKVPMRDHWEEDIEVAGPGLASVKAEGAEMATGTVVEGYRQRYIATTIALRVIYSEELMEDKKYNDAVKWAKWLKRSILKTIDIDCALMLVRGFDTNYAFGGTGQPLWSTSQPLAHGGTWSNSMTTPAAPSRMAAIAAITQIGLFPGLDGIREGYMAKRILCPFNQWAVWRGVIGSKNAPEPGAFNEINVINEDYGDMEVVANPYWNNTTTNWAVQTDWDEETGFNIRFRREPRSRTWEDNAFETASHGVSARYARGMSNPRCTLGVNA